MNEEGIKGNSGNGAAWTSQQRWLGSLFAGAAVVLMLWSVAARWNRRTPPEFELTGEWFASFLPAIRGREAVRMPVSAEPIEPNIVVFQFRSLEPDVVSRGAPVVSTRLVHGYNMCDCMRIKGYTVEPIPVPEGRVAGMPHVQAWRLKSGGGDVSVWVTSMLDASRFGSLDMDVRTVPFPRVGTPDDPGWVPRGLTLSSLRHPFRELRQRVKARWNSSRCDWLTFLGLKRAEWASEEVLTLVSASKGRVAKPEEESAVLGEVLALHTSVWRQLVEWRRRGP